jgi:hypothetical protein
LETKGGWIICNVMKFYNNYQALVVAFNENNFSNEDMFYKALEFSKMKHPKKGSFVFIHCWLIFKDVLRWAKTKQETRRWMTPMKRKLLIDDVVNLIKSMEEAWGVEISKVGAKCYNSYKAHK